MGCTETGPAARPRLGRAMGMVIKMVMTMTMKGEV